MFFVFLQGFYPCLAFLPALLPDDVVDLLRVKAAWKICQIYNKKSVKIYQLLIAISFAARMDSSSPQKR